MKKSTKTKEEGNSKDSQSKENKKKRGSSKGVENFKVSPS